VREPTYLQPRWSPRLIRNFAGIRTSRRSRHCFLPGSIRRAVNCVLQRRPATSTGYAAQPVGGKTRTRRPMLGALKESRYDSGRVCLNPGDLLLAYSDGLTECRNSLDEEFEMERLTAAGKAMGGATANQVLFSTLGLCSTCRRVPAGGMI